MTTIDPTTLGGKLRAARENRRVTQEQAARAIGIPRTALVHIEAGKRSLSTLELSRLAKLYDRPVADFFSEDDLGVRREEDSRLVLHRLTSGLIDDPAIERQVTRCLELCRIGVELEATLGLRHTISLPSYELTAPTKPFEAIHQGEWVAEEERRRLGLGSGPIADLADLITAQGLWAAGVRNLPEPMSGIFLRHSSVRMVILVNRDHPRSGQRFSYAHEYAHALLDRNASAIVSSKANSLDLGERRANAFAAAFLLPAEGVKRFLELLEKGGPSRRYRVTSTPADDPIATEERPEPGSQQITYQDAAALAHYFDASYPATVYRLSDLGFLNAAETTRLIERSELGRRFTAFLDHDGRRGERAAAMPDRELVGQIIRLAVEAYRREEVSQGWLRDLSDKVDMPADELVELAEAAID